MNNTLAGWWYNEDDDFFVGGQTKGYPTLIVFQGTMEEWVMKVDVDL